MTIKEGGRWKKKNLNRINATEKIEGDMKSLKTEKLLKKKKGIHKMMDERKKCL